jgi:hypothetical protein
MSGSFQPGCGIGRQPRRGQSQSRREKNEFVATPACSQGAFIIVSSVQ